MKEGEDEKRKYVKQLRMRGRGGGGKRWEKGERGNVGCRRKMEERGSVGWQMEEGGRRN